jgi:hypothetical protein
MGSSSKDFFFNLLRFSVFFIIYPVLVYRSSLGDFGSPYFIFSSTLLFLIFLLSVLIAIGALIDLKRSLEEKSTWTALFDFLFFLVFVLTSSIALSYFVREVISHIFSKVY